MDQIRNQLSDVLDQHSHDIHDLPAGERLASVRQRVRRTRQRRRAVVAGGAAAAVAVVAVALVLPDGDSRPDPAASRTDLAGHDAPASFTSLGSTYAFDRAETDDDGSLSISLGDSDTPRLIAWATSDGRADLRAPGLVLTPDSSAKITGVPATFGSFEYVAPGADVGKVTVSTPDGDGDVAIAVYELSELAPGVTSDGLVYRDEVAGQPLLDAAWGAEGETTLTLEVPATGRAMTLEADCWGVPDAWIDIAVGGAFTSSGQCSTDTPLLSGEQGQQIPRRAPGTTVRVEVRMTSGPDSDVALSAPAAHLGAALYEKAGSAEAIGDFPLAPILEEGGHTWQLASAATADPGLTQVRGQVVVADTPKLIVFVGAGLGRGSLRAGIDGEEAGSRLIVDASSGASGSITAQLWRGSHPVGLRFTGEPEPDQVLGFATYERLD